MKQESELILPEMLLVEQQLTDRRLPDVAAAVMAQMNGFPIPAHLKPGDKIAIAVGSRGIKNIPLIVRTVVDYWKAMGFKPFIFPAMGSHAGATAEGQKDFLAGLGITEDAMGCAIKSSMDVVETGTTPDGIKTYTDANAANSAAAFPIGRVKWHTDFEGEIESGLIKMTAVGMGKLEGAKECHRFAYEGIPMEKVIRQVARQIFATNKVIGGLAILEDAYNNTAEVAAIPVAEIEAKEIELLAKVKSWRAHIPVRELDLLIVNEIGKIISGPGMDTTVVNRSSTTGAYNPWKDLTWIARIYARFLHPNSQRNGMGVGMADVIRDDIVRAMDEETTRINATAAYIPRVAQVPLYHYPTDLRCLKEIAQLTPCGDPSKLKIGWIENSMMLNRLYLSKTLLPEIEANRNLKIIGEVQKLEFNSEGQLPTRPSGFSTDDDLTTLAA